MSNSQTRDITHQRSLNTSKAKRKKVKADALIESHEQNHSTGGNILSSGGDVDPRFGTETEQKNDMEFETQEQMDTARPFLSNSKRKNTPELSTSAKMKKS